MNNQENNPSQSRQTQVVYGDLDVHHDLNVGGMLNARVVRGRNAFCGLFLNQEVLEYHFPHPLVGQWALVINVDSNQNNEPAQDEEEEPTLAIGWVFDCETEGTWHDAQYRGGCDVEAILVEKSQREAADAELAAADTALGGRIDTEEAARLAGDITQVEYNAEEDSIDLKNSANALKVRIPAAAFGHVDDVQVTGDNLVITFNEDAEKQPIEIPLTRFFDPANYYTKSQVYAKSEVYTKSETDNAIGGEATNRENADTALGGRIDDEVLARGNADTMLGGRIDAEAAARLAADITQGFYNSETGYIELQNVAGFTKCSIDARPFVKDGMVYNVQIVDGNLVIRFNTDAGKLPISIPLTAIFNPANYYTKSEVDENIGAEAALRQQGDAGLGERIDTEANARLIGDNTLDGRINNEKLLRQNADADLQEQINGFQGSIDTLQNEIDDNDYDVITNEEMDAVLS